jgi:hypothetical protein
MNRFARANKAAVTGVIGAQMQEIFDKAHAAGEKAATEMDTTGWADGQGYVAVKLGQPAKSAFAKWYAWKEALGDVEVKMDGVRVRGTEFRQIRRHRPARGLRRRVRQSRRRARIYRVSLHLPDMIFEAVNQPHLSECRLTKPKARGRAIRTHKILE